MKAEIRASIAARLHEERERLAWSQTDMAAIAGGSRRAVVEWEKGATVPGADALAEMAQKGLDVLYVLTAQRTPTSVDALSAEETALVDNYKNADDEGRAAARRVLDALAQPARKKA